ncbi:MAG: Unknown protein [uncultured Sulfurovum sp.]|uniref:Uncharacterized protein n=1 Tax=uncultured Sulfurovum sp. TaxID=269237 RepID=A0A6S6SQZ1_9BACT|nr:MAG: Unknown protein [uncultured Sulfurovum sp.]
MNSFITSIEQYDAQTNLYFKSITNENTKNEDTKNKDRKSSLFSKITAESVNVVNIAIVDTLLDSYSLLFDEKSSVNIAFLLFELDYDEEEKNMKFYNQCQAIMNNKNIDKRGIKDKLLIGLHVDKKIELWMSNKRGNSLKKLVTIEKDDKWHLDVKNCKIRVLSSVNSEFFIKNFSW